MTDKKTDEEGCPPPYTPGLDNLPAYHELPGKKVLCSTFLLCSCNVLNLPCPSNLSLMSHVTVKINVQSERKENCSVYRGKQ